MDKLKTSYLRLCKLKFKIVIKIGLQKFPKQKQYPNNTETSCSRHSSHKKKKKTSQGESVANHICTSNKIFGRAIWNKLPMYIFENRPNQTCGYWLITPNQHFVLKVISFNSRQLQKAPLTVWCWLQSTVWLVLLTAAKVV